VLIADTSSRQNKFRRALLFYDGDGRAEINAEITFKQADQPFSVIRPRLLEKESRAGLGVM
jgi:hypothetical protein